jgi:glycolate oxidase iron-sulfur subunit
VTGFDDVRAPSLDTIDDCVHCGFCLPTCPTYALWGEEMDSPRGRIVLMKAAHEEAELSPAMVEHWDRCLGCMACVTACPSGVRYDQLIEDTRAQVERRTTRPWRERAARRAAFALFPRPGRLRALAPALAVARVLRLDLLAARAGAPGAELAPRTPLRAALRRLPTRFAARGRARGSVALLQGCVARVFFGDVNRAAAEVLSAEGFDVHAPARPRCCGALQLHAGDAEPARALARETIVALEGHEHVVVTAAGCGSAMKDYPHLLRDDDDWRDRAEAFAAKVRDLTELLAAVEPRAPRAPVPLRAAYHDACHLAHAQGIREEPRALMRAIPGVELLEPAERELCCGSAGVYNLLQPEAASELGERKARNLLDTGAEAVVAANPGCALQIAAHAGLPVLHPAELLWRSIDGS